MLGSFSVSHPRTEPPAAESHPESVRQHFGPSAVGVRGNANEEFSPGEEDVAALQGGPSKAGVHLHHCQLQLRHHPLHRLHLQGGNAAAGPFQVKHNQPNKHTCCFWTLQTVTSKRPLSLLFKFPP